MSKHPDSLCTPAEDSFSRRLIDWQRRHGRHDLPWQNTRDAYRIWLSEIMLQQTQVSRRTRMQPPNEAAFFEKIFECRRTSGRK
jgi:predicted ATPase